MSSAFLGEVFASRSRVSYVRALAIFGLGLVYLANLFIGSGVLTNVALALMIAATLLCLIAVKGSSRVIAYIAFALSVGLLITYHAPWRIWTQGLENNLYLVVMFSMVPLLRIPIRRGGYFEALQAVFRRFVTSRSRFYIFVSVVSAFIGSIVNLAVIPLVYEVSRASAFSRDKRLLSAAMTRGFTTATVWAPTMASIALVMQLTGAKWIHFFPAGLGCGIFAGLVGYLVTMAEGRHQKPSDPPALADESHAVPPGPVEDGSTKAYAKFIELCLFALVLIVMIALVSYLTGIRTIPIVSITALVFPFFWMALLRRLPALVHDIRTSYLPETLPNLSGEVVLFAGAGMFATALGYSGLGKYIPQALSTAVGGNVLLLTTAMIALAMILGAIGVHPIVTVAVFGGTIHAAALGVTPVYLATVLALCWTMSLAVSPSSATIIATAALARESPLRVGTRWNGPYAVVTALALIAFITTLRLFGAL